MYLNEVFKGRYHEQPKVTSFPNDKNLDEIYTVGLFLSDLHVHIT